jgi:glycosyltransferase involved in cell wall biosynthesis
MKIAVVQRGKYTAIEHYRQEVPHAYLNKIGVETFTLESPFSDLSEYTDEQLKDFSHIQFSRIIGTNGGEQAIVDRLRKLGLKIIFDIDDNWILPPYHHLNPFYQKHKVSERTTECIRLADLVTVSTEHLAKKVRVFNNNTHVIPNAIPKDLAVKRDIKSNRVRFGYAAGVYHLKDAMVLENAVKMLYKPNGVNYDKFQFVLCGFNVGSNEYKILEMFLTGGYAFKNTEKEYSKYLMSFTQMAEHNGNDKPYKRVWALPVREYLDCLNNFDVALAPLYDDSFTRCKSELKAIEAGMMGKALICSPVQPYKGLTNRKNCLFALTDKDWNLAFKQLINNNELLKDLQAALAEHIEENFNFVKIQNERKQIYECN